MSDQSRKSRIISTVLTPAVKLWVRSQLEHADELQLSIEAGDRQLLSGAIGRVAVSARNAVYRGLHLTEASIVGEQIRTNLAQVLRGKPLRLLQAFPISGEIRWHEADVNTSLKSPLFANAVIEFLLTLLQLGGSDGDIADQSPNAIQLQDPQVILGDGQATLAATLLSVSGTRTPVVIRTGLRLSNGNQLHLDRPQWLPHMTARQGLPLRELDGHTFDLGETVYLESVSLEQGRVLCRGQITVMPEAADDRDALEN